MKTHVEFQSNIFPAYENEDDEINPGRFGKRLAEYISSELKKLNIQTSEPEAEDWGWMIELNNEEFNKIKS